MLPNVVTFWDGPLDRLRQLCLRSQIAAGHGVTVYSFEPIADLPDGVGNAAAEAILPRAFAEKLRPSTPDGRWRGWTPVQFSDFFRIQLMARGEGLWLDADVLLKTPITIDPAKPYFAWERPRQIGNSVLYLPAHDPVVAAFTELMARDDLTPDWLSLRHRATLALRRLGDRSLRAPDLRVALYGPPALTALARRAGHLHHVLPKQTFYAVHAEPKLFFDPIDVAALVNDPAILGFHVSPKTRRNETPVAGSLYAWAMQRFPE